MSIIYRMKYILLFISFLSLCLFGSRALTGVLPETEAVADVPAMYWETGKMTNETDMGTILPLESTSPLGMMAFTEVDLMARQFGSHHRSQRLTNLSCSWLSKAIYRRMAALSMAMQTHTSTHVFSSLPYQSWTVSSEHYIFGMRRILI